jgi:5-methylcytosine-specific restriction enzyme subunit McrC
LGAGFPGLLKPDITVWSAASGQGKSVIKRVIDAKWKRLDPRAGDFGVLQQDVYQVAACALQYECKDVELAYPWLENKAGSRHAATD